MEAGTRSVHRLRRRLVGAGLRRPAGAPHHGETQGNRRRWDGAPACTKESFMEWWRRLLVLLLCAGAGLAQAAITLDAGSLAHPVEHELAWQRDDTGRLDLAAVLRAPAAAWQQNEAAVFSKGYANHASWWLRFEVRKRAGFTQTPLLEIAYPVLDEVEVWLLRDGQVQDHQLMGDKLPFAARPVPHRFFLVPLALQDDQDYTVLLRVRTSSSVQVPLTLWGERAYHEHDQQRLLGQGLYFGCMLVMVLYNIFLFLIIRERNFLYFLLHALAMPLFLASLNGLAFQFLWPTATTWNDQAIIVTLNVAVFFGIMFTSRFLQMRQYLPQLMPLIGTLLAASLALSIAAFFVAYPLLIRLTIVVSALNCLVGLTSGILRVRQGDRAAFLYCLAWSVMLGGGIVLALAKFHLLPLNVITGNATQFGSAFVVLLLSIALAERINHERMLRYNAQQDALQSERKLRHTQGEMLEAQRRANEQLEQRVRERTAELEIANGKLAELSATDQLTGLKNRRFLDALLAAEFARCSRYGHSIAVLLLDIDRFKLFNDTFGHLVGDACLREVAAAVAQAVRAPVDRVARYGGEEFCVVMPETDSEGARLVAERIRATVEAMVFNVEGRRVPVTVSVGVAALIPAEGDTVPVLIATADRALYAAKEAGRNRVVEAA
jgi:diguanylate cyclase